MTQLVDGINVVQAADTPIAQAIDAVPADLKSATGTKILVLITDSQEIWPNPDLCGKDPAVAIRALVKKGIDARVNIVGLAVTDRRARQNLIALGAGRQRRLLLGHRRRGPGDGALPGPASAVPGPRRERQAGWQRRGRRAAAVAQAGRVPRGRADRPAGRVRRRCRGRQAAGAQPAGVAIAAGRGATLHRPTHRGGRPMKRRRPERRRTVSCEPDRCRSCS